MPSQTRDDTLCSSGTPDGQRPLSPDRHQSRADALPVQLPRRENQTPASRVQAGAEASSYEKPAPDYEQARGSRLLLLDETSSLPPRPSALQQLGFGSTRRASATS